MKTVILSTPFYLALRALSQNLPGKATNKFCDNGNVRLRQLQDWFSPFFCRNGFIIQSEY